MGTVTREFLEKLTLKPKKPALVDMEAGIEHFGRGVEASTEKFTCTHLPRISSATCARASTTLGCLFAGRCTQTLPDRRQMDISRKVFKALDDVHLSTEPEIIRRYPHELNMGALLRACIARALQSLPCCSPMNPPEPLIPAFRPKC